MKARTGSGSPLPSETTTRGLRALRGRAGLVACTWAVFLLSTASLAGGQETAPLSGQVVDAATGQGLDDVTVDLRQGTRRETCVPDREGRFTSSDPFRAGAVRVAVRLLDGTRVRITDGRVEHVLGNARPVRIEVRIGPRYRVSLEVDGQLPQKAWTARWRIDGPLSSSRSGPSRALEGEPPRVRFPAPLPDLDPGQTVVLEVQDADGEWIGESALPSIEGDNLSLLAVGMRQVGAIRGRLVDAKGEGLSGALLYLAVVGASPLPVFFTDPWTRHRAEDDGSFSISRLEPGEYHLRLVPPDEYLISRRLHIEKGSVDLGDVVFPGHAERADLVGTLESLAGRPGPSVMLDLVSQDGRVLRGWITPGFTLARLWFQRPGWMVDPASLPHRQEFRFPDVPVGEYVLRVASLDGWPYEQTEIPVRVPSADVHVRRRDEGPRFGFGFRVIDAATGRELTEYQARFRTGLWQKPRWSSPDHGTWASGDVLAKVSPKGEVQWSVWADGYRERHGDLADFAYLEGDDRILTLQLEPGYSACFLVRDASDPRREFRARSVGTSVQAPGARPLQGVTILCDGEPVGLTDEAGVCEVVLQARPGSVEFRKTGWLAAPGPCWATGKLLTATRTPDCWMVPVEDGR